MDIIVQGDDSDPDGDDQDVTGATSPNWTVTVHGDNALTFVLVENFNGDTAITYTIDDGNGGMAQAAVNVHVTPVNDDQVANDDATSTVFNTSVTFDVALTTPTWTATR